MELAKYSGSWLTRLCGQSAWVHQPRLIQCSREVDRKKQRPCPSGSSYLVLHGVAYPVCGENRCLEVTFGLNLRSCGRPWSYRTTFSTIPRSRDEKSSKMTSKWRLRSTFTAALASFCLHFAGSAVTWQALFALFAKSSATLCGKAVFSYIDTTPTPNALF